LLSISSFASPMVINGHEYVACQARKAGIRFTKEGNCFTHISDAAGLARIADTLSGCCLAFHPIRSGPATINGNPRDHAPCGSRHLTQSGRRSHSCRLADPGNGYSNSRACLAAKHIPRGGHKFPRLRTFCCPQGHFFAAQSAKKRRPLSGPQREFCSRKGRVKQL